MKRIFLIIIGFLLFYGLSAQEIPQKISYQGKLLENGIPVTGSKTMEFTIGSWNETQSIYVNEGLYSVTLGQYNPIPISLFDNSSSLSLQIEVEGTTLTPTTVILSSPYAFKAEKSVDTEKIDGNPVTGTPSTDDVLTWNGSSWVPDIAGANPTGPAGGDLSGEYPDPTVAKIQNNPVSSSSPSTDDVLKWSGSQWAPEPDETLDGASAGGDLSGTYPDPTVIKIQNDPVSSSSPSTDDVLKWSGSQWSPEPDETLSGASAGGDLSGTYPNPTVTKIQNKPVSSTSPTTDQVLQWNGSNWTPSTISSGSCYWTQSGSDINYTTGNVQIGTTSGGNQKLKVYSGNNQGIYLLNNSSGDIGLKIVNQAGAHRPLMVDNESDQGVYFGSSGNSSYAVQITNSGTGHGLRINNSNGGRGLYVVNSGGNYAGYFAGSSANVVVEGTLSKGGGTFKIDHPLDPENKYLYHSFVESPDMMNVYNGNVILDNNGEAIVQLPEWFSSLNKDFRYQLTCIGGYAPIFIAEKISDNQFKIAGGSLGLEVSWQVTGVRQDPFANEHRVQVEVQKPADERGYYLHYKEYNQPEEKSIWKNKDSESENN